MSSIVCVNCGLGWDVDDLGAIGYDWINNTCARCQDEPFWLDEGDAEIIEEMKHVYGVEV